jgi:hypothetical protein
LTAQPSVANSQQFATTIAGDNRQAVDVHQTQSVSVTAGGTASAASGGACAAQACGAPVAAPSNAPLTPPSTVSAAGSSQAGSGAATSQGLQASTTVNTNATASVSVGGRNFAPIQILIDAISTIRNWGSATATSGSATSAAQAPAQPAAASNASASASGQATATGAQLQGQTTLTSSASVHVTGNNYSPINIILDLAASYLNWGVAGASSGDARTSAAALPSGGGGASAASGAASATGLQVDDRVDLAASAFVRVDGDNYAPIFIHIKFLTDVDNRGWAQATTGAAQAGTGTQVTNAAAPPQSTAVTTAAGTAKSGPARAVGDTIRVTAVSQQVASANGQVIGDSAAPTTLSVTGVPSAPSAAGAPAAAAPAVPATTDVAVDPPPTNAISGAATAMAPQLDVQTSSTQTSTCLAAESTCTASNSASLTVESDPALISEPDMPPLPPAPSGGQPGSGSAGHGSGGGGPTHSANLQTTTITSSASGTRVVVNPFLVLTARRLPPLPDQPPARSATGGLANQDPWAESLSAGIPPLPDPDLAAADATEVAGAPIGAAAVTRPARVGGQTQTAIGSIPAASTGPALEPQSPVPVVDLNPAAERPETGNAPAAAPVISTTTVNQPSSEISEPATATEAASEPVAQALAASGAEPAPFAEIAGAFAAAAALIGLLVWKRRAYLANWRRRG